jgi:hypothetical protein
MNLEKLGYYISEERLKLYLEYTNNDIEKAITLYELNIETTSTLIYPLSMFEVILRNCVNRVLTDEYGDNWYDGSFILPKNAIAVEKIKDILQREGKEINNTNIVSNSNLGLWTEFFSSRYMAKGFTTKFAVMFANKKYPPDSYSILLVIKNNIRNRISHQENIIKYDVYKNYSLLLKFISFVDRDLANYVDYKSKFKEIFNNNKTQLMSFNNFYKNKEKDTRLSAGL